LANIKILAHETNEPFNCQACRKRVKKGETNFSARCANKSFRGCCEAHAKQILIADMLGIAAEKVTKVIDTDVPNLILLVVVKDGDPMVSFIKNLNLPVTFWIRIGSEKLYLHRIDGGEGLKLESGDNLVTDSNGNEYIITI